MAKKKKTEEQPAELENPLKEWMPNYKVYQLSKSEKSSVFVVAFLAGAVCSQVFYGGLFKVEGEATLLTYISTVITLILGGLMSVKVALPFWTDRMRKKRQHRLSLQFRDMLESVTTSLSAGDTVHQAFETAYSDICLQYGSQSELALELEQCTHAAGSGVTLETMLKDLAERSGNEDIQNFSNVFSVCYTTGGNMRDVMRRTHDIITDKMAIAEEIRTKLSSNQLELNVISVAPVFIMLLLRTTNPSFSAQFATFGGVVCITIALVIFVVAFRMGRKIVEIGED